MAVPTIYEDTTTTVISACESTTNWTGPTAATDAELKREGNNSLSFIVRSTSDTLIYFSGTIPNLTNSHLRLWFNAAWAGVMESLANHGCAYYLRDTSSNVGYWNMLGNTNYNGGWVQLLVDTARSFDSTTGGAPNLASLDRVGIACRQTTTPRRQVNTWIDRLEYNDGLTITGGTANDPLTWNDIAAAENDSTGAWGVVVKEADTVYLRGRVTLGDDTNDTYFKDTSKVLQFQDEKVASDLYTLQIRSGSSNTTSVQMGEVAGTGDNSLGYNGCVIGADGTQTWTLDAVDSNVDTLKLYGCTFTGCDDVFFGDTTNDLGKSGSTIHLVDNAFANSNLLTRAIDGSATVLQLGNKVVNFDDTSGSVLVADSLGVDGDRLAVLNNDAFQSRDDGTSETITVTDHDFGGNDLFLVVHNDKVWDIVNPSWTVTTADQSDIDFIGSDGTTEKVSEKFSLDVTVSETDLDPIASAEVYIYEGTTNQDLPNQATTDASGQISTSVLKKVFYDGGDQNNTNSLSLNGVSEGANISDASQTGLDITGDLSIEAWLYPDSTPLFGTYDAIAGKGTTSNAYTFSLKHGNRGGLDLEAGSSQYVYVTETNQTGLNLSGDFTVEAVVRLESTPTASNSIAIASKWDSTNDQRCWAFSYGLDATSAPVYQLNLSSDGTGDSTIQSVGAGTTLSASTWYNLAVSYTASTGVAKFYVDGTVDSTASGGPPTLYNDSTADFNIGYSQAATQYYDGLFNEVRVWDVVRSTSEINDNQTARSVLQHRDLQGCWYFENNLVDMSTNENDLTASGSPTYSNLLSTGYLYSLYLELNDGTNDFEYRSTPIDYSTGSWQHVAVTWDSSTGVAKFYYNKSLAGTMQRSITVINDPAENFEIGLKNGGNALAADVDTVRVWSVVRTAAQIGYAVNSSGLEGHWRFNNDATDDSTNGNDLTLVGSPSYTSSVGDVPSLRQDTYGNFALKVYKWGYVPYAAGITIDTALDVSVILGVDNDLDATSAAQAISDGTAVTVSHPSNKYLLLSYDGGTVAFSAGDVVTGASSGADGTVEELVEGDTVSGRLLLKNWDGINFTNNEALQVSAATRAYAELSGGDGQYTYSWLIDAAGETPQVVYDYMAAKMADATLDAIFEDAIEWGEGEHARMVKVGVSGFYTDRNVNLQEGVWITDRGTGTIAYFESDGGYQYTPPASVQFQFTGLKYEDAVGTEVRLYKTSDDSFVDGTEDAGADGIYTYNYAYTGDVGVYAVVLHNNYKWLRINGLTLGDQDQVVPVQQIVDRVYDNP